MIRLLLGTALIATSLSAPAVAQSAGGPQIAYVKVSGSTNEIYLVNPDGSGLKKLYTAPRKYGITTLDLKPGGNEIAFVERASGVPATLKKISFNDAGAAVGTATTIALPCAPDYLDYHPTEPKLIFSAICGTNSTLATVNTDGSAFTALHQGPTQTTFHGQPRWLPDGTYVYVYADDAMQLHLCRNECVAADRFYSASNIGRVDVGRTANTALVDGPSIYISEVDAAAGAVLRSNFITGRGGHYSPDDRNILYATNHSASGDYLQIYNGNTGQIARITAKGTFGPADWRN
jgi:hypothetical protein